MRHALLKNHRTWNQKKSMMAKFIVSEFEARREGCTGAGPRDAWRTFIGGFYEETLPYFIQTKITEYLDDDGGVEQHFMKTLVDEVLQCGNMCNGDEDCKFLIIDELKPKILTERSSLLECKHYNLKEHLAALRKSAQEAKDEEARTRRVTRILFRTSSKCDSD